MGSPLATSHELLRALIDALPDYIFVKDRHGRFITVNDSLLDAFNVASQEEIVGKTDYDYHPASMAKAFAVDDNSVMASGKALISREEAHEDTTGKRRWLSTTKVPTKDAAGNATGLIGISRDITTQKAAQDELRRNNNHLLIETRRAEEASRAKSEFLAAMSHEIRTPMNAILGMADLLSDSDLDAEQHKYVEVFRRAGQNLLALISDILDLSKIESGHFDIEQVDFELADVISRCIELARPRVRTDSVELILDMDPDLPSWLIGDPARLQQILINLLGNAAKFTDSGEIVLKVERASAGDAGRIRFSVIDTGIGIAAVKLPVIFDDFKQADSSTTRRYGGTGLGLGIAKRLVVRMDGELKVASELGVGSTFSFTAVFRVFDSRETPLAPVVDDFAGLRALVIDDNATNCLIFRKHLTSWGFESTECRSAREGLVALIEAGKQQRPFAVLLLDMRMPDTDGLSAVEMVHRVASDLPIVALSSDDRPGDATRFRELGVATYATKPVSRRELLRLVQNALRVMDHPDADTSSAATQPPTAIEPAGRATRLLIAEDSIDNQFLIDAYLQNAGYELKFVTNGKEAVEEFQASSYDLVLVDVQMPVMDGLTATRQIRAIEKRQGNAPIPILALSANAFEHDQTASLEAGCDLHLSKPIAKQVLIDEIRRWLDLNEVHHDPSPLEIPPEIKELAGGYLQRRRQELPEMRTSLERLDCDRLKTFGHNMKGAAKGYGFPVLAAIGASLEQGANSGDAGGMAADIECLAEYLDQCRITVSQDDS